MLGGSVSYACAAASFLSKVGMVAIVGKDFPEEYLETYKKFGVDLEGLERAEGKTFRWSGKYAEDKNQRETLSIDLNVFETFKPRLPESYKTAPVIFLANISPDLQLHVLSQIKDPRLVVADTMDLWINNTRDQLMELISKIDILMLNDSEACLLAGKSDLVECGRMILEWGPSKVVVKKGEYGSVLISEESVSEIPAYTVELSRDPTGAGDSFAGGFLGSVCRAESITDEAMIEALVYGSAIASFTVEDFSLRGLESVTKADIEDRVGAIRGMIK